MSTATFDPDRYRAERSGNWDRVAEAWREWSETLESGAQPLSDRMVELAGIGPGSRVLDVATGAGEPAGTAARRVAPGGSVLATDLSEAMLRVARERASALGLGNVEFRRLDVDAAPLDLPPGRFDAILCRWGLMFLLEPAPALARLRDRLRPGGRLVAAVWGPPELVPWLGLANRVLGQRLQLPPPPPGQPTPFSLCSPEQLHCLFAEAGFADVSVESLVVTFTLPSPEAYARFHQEAGAGGYLAPLLARYPAEARSALWRAVAAAARAYLDPDGQVRIPNVSLIGVGRT